MAVTCPEQTRISQGETPVWSQRIRGEEKGWRDSEESKDEEEGGDEEGGEKREELEDVGREEDKVQEVKRVGDNGGK